MREVPLNSGLLAISPDQLQRSPMRLGGADRAQEGVVMDGWRLLPWGIF